MQIVHNTINCHLLSTTHIPDNRGWFRIAFNIDELHDLGLDFRGVCQLNHSLTDVKGIVRGLNYQEEPFAQAKVVRCTRGALYSVAVDINPESENFGKWCGYELTAENGYVMYVPKTFAHGFVSLEDETELEYFTDNKYSFPRAKSIRFDDPQIGIDWTVGGRVVLTDIQSEKNRKAPLLADAIKR